jgi:hypothetical protein
MSAIERFTARNEIAIGTILARKVDSKSRLAIMLLKCK